MAVEVSEVDPTSPSKPSCVSPASFQAVLDALPVPIFFKDARGIYRGCNAAFERYLGRGRTQIIGLSVDEIAPPELARVYRAADEALLASRETQLYEARVAWADGTVRDVLFSKGVVLDERGKAAGLAGSIHDITDRKRDERALRDNEALATALFTLAPSGVNLLDDEGRIRAFSDRAHELLGYTREEFARLSMFDIAAGDEPGDLRAGLARSLAIDQQEFDSRLRTKAGGLRHVRVRTKRLAIAGERRILAVWHDDTDRHLVEGELRRTERLLGAISDAVPDPIFVKDRGGRWLFSNPAALAAVGKPSEQVLGKTDREIFADASVGAALTATDQRIMGSGVPELVEETIDTPSGARVYLSTKVPYRDPEGRIIGIIGNARDITDRKRAGELLRRSEARFRAVIEKSTDMILILDGAARVRFWSPGATEMLGWDPREVEDRSLLELVHPDDRAVVEERFSSVLSRDGDTTCATWRFRHSNGTWRLVEARGRNLLQDADVEGVVVNARDVTEQRHIQEQFHQAQTMESIGRLAGGVAHDFNNLLTVILSCAESLQEDLQDGAPVDLEAVTAIRGAGERARDLTRQLLAFARRQVIAPKPVHLDAVARGMETLLGRLLGEDITLVFDLQPDLWPVRADPAQVEQVIMNLAVNARDAMPGGGTLTIEARNAATSTEAPVLADRVAMSPGVRLVVRDTGIGMTPDVQARVFEPFFTTKAQGKGTGLGLATVFGIVEQSGGTISVESEPGRGTAFTIVLPRTADAVESTEPGTVTTSTSGTETVLVVDDDPLVRDVTVRALRSGGYQVLAAAGGDDALALAGRTDTHLDLVVTDVVMPGMDGSAVAEELRRRDPRLPVLFVSGHTHDCVLRHGVSEGNVEFLSKPFTASSLRARIRQMLDVASRASRPASAGRGASARSAR